MLKQLTMYTIKCFTVNYKSLVYFIQKANRDLERSINLNRKELMNEIKIKIEEELIQDMSKDFVASEYKDKKNGIYFLYDENEIVIYVGKCGNGDHTSFYDRIYGHGNGAHCRKEWFNSVKKFRFKAFPNLESDALSKVERLMIYANNQPIYNDCYITEADYEIIASNL